MSELEKKLADAQLVKAHVKGYWRKDGTFVKDYDTPPADPPAAARQSPAPTAAPEPVPAPKTHSQPPGWFQSKYGGAGHKPTVPALGLFAGPQAKPKAPPKVWHPELDTKGKKVPIFKPHQASDPSCWAHADQVAVVTPGGELPEQLNGIALTPWTTAPKTEAEWEHVDGQVEIDEPPFECPEHLEPAAGVVVEEPDGRLWLVAPTNGFGGAPHVFPKGRTDDMPLQASAIKEAYEESGLQVEINGFVGDFNRTQTRTRFYLAKRVGGTPAAMGWESQAVLLVPREKLGEYLTGGANVGVLAAVQGL